MYTICHTHTHTKQIKKKELLMQQKHSEANVRIQANIGKLTPSIAKG
jgi:hypothetical protein